MPDRPSITDPRVLRAFAHPVRSRILEELNARGPQRSADLARLLDLPANQVSFHVRNLAGYGLVEEAPELARDRRDRVWRAADGGDGFRLDLEAVAAAPGGTAVAAAWRGRAGARAHRAVDAAYTAARDPAVLRSITEATFLLTKDEAAELEDELTAVLHRWTARSRAAGEGGSGDGGSGDGGSGDGGDRDVYALLQILQPRVPDEEEPGQGAEG